MFYLIAKSKWEVGKNSFKTKNFGWKKNGESIGVVNNMKEKTLIKEKIILPNGQKRFSITEIVVL